MLFSTPSQFIVMALLLAVGWLFGFASHPGGKKWKRRAQEEAAGHAIFRNAADKQLREAQRRIADLERDAAAMTGRHAEAEATIAELREHPAVIAPVPVAVEADPVPPARPEPEAAWLEEATVAHHDLPDEPLPHQVETPDTDVYHRAPADEQPADDAPAEPVEPLESAATLPPAAPPPDTPIVQSAALPAFPMTPTPSDTAPAPIGPAEPEMPKQGWFGGTVRDDLTRLRGIDGPMNTKLFGLGVTRFEDIEKLSDEDEMALEQRLGVPVGLIGRDQWRQQAALLRAGNVAEHAERFGPGPDAG